MKNYTNPKLITPTNEFTNAVQKAVIQFKANGKHEYKEIKDVQNLLDCIYMQTDVMVPYDHTRTNNDKRIGIMNIESLEPNSNGVCVDIAGFIYHQAWSDSSLRSIRLLYQHKYEVLIEGKYGITVRLPDTNTIIRFNDLLDEVTRLI